MITQNSESETAPAVDLHRMVSRPSLLELDAAWDAAWVKMGEPHMTPTGRAIAKQSWMEGQLWGRQWAANALRSATGADEKP